MEFCYAVIVCCIRWSELDDISAGCTVDWVNYVRLIISNSIMMASTSTILIRCLKKDTRIQSRIVSALKSWSSSELSTQHIFYFSLFCHRANTYKTDNPNNSNRILYQFSYRLALGWKHLVVSSIDFLKQNCQLSKITSTLYHGVLIH